MPVAKLMAAPLKPITANPPDILTAQLIAWARMLVMPVALLILEIIIVMVVMLICIILIQMERPAMPVRFGIMTPAAMIARTTAAAADPVRLFAVVALVIMMASAGILMT